MDGDHGFCTRSDCTFEFIRIHVVVFTHIDQNRSCASVNYRRDCCNERVANGYNFVARTNSGTPWGLDVWLSPGQSYTRTFGRGTYNFRVPERSSLRGVSCYGACGTVTVS